MNIALQVTKRLATLLRKGREANCRERTSFRVQRASDRLGTRWVMGAHHVLAKSLLKTDLGKSL